MRKIIIGCLAVALIGVVEGARGAPATDHSKPAGMTTPIDSAAAPTAGASSAPGDTTPPLDLVKKTVKGQLTNPYNDKIKDIADEGHEISVRRLQWLPRRWWRRWHVSATDQRYVGLWGR